MSAGTTNTDYSLKPTIKIPIEVYRKVMHWVNKATGEVSGFGKVRFEDGAFHILDAYLVEQENGAATTDIDAKGMAALMHEKITEPGHLNWWWHSHVNMSVFWSGTDVSTIKQIGGQGMCLATVFNKKNDSRSAYCQGPSHDGFYPALFADNLKLVVTYPVDESNVAAWDEEFDAKCKEKTYSWGKGIGTEAPGQRKVALYVPDVKDENGNDIPYLIRSEHALDWENMGYIAKEEWMDYLEEKGLVAPGTTSFHWSAKAAYIKYQHMLSFVVETKKETSASLLDDAINQGARRGA